VGYSPPSATNVVTDTTTTSITSTLTAIIGPDEH
jgi:hypothetical protein